MSDDETKRLEWEETRRCMLKVYTSHIQTHAGLLIALIIGTFTLISRFNDFFTFGNVINSSLTFWLLLSLLIGASFYIVARFFYWTFYDATAISVSYTDIKKHKQKMQSDYPDKEIADTYVLSKLTKETLTNPNAKLSIYHKLFSKQSERNLALSTIGITMASFLVFLWINGFLWQF